MFRIAVLIALAGLTVAGVPSPLQERPLQPQEEPKDSEIEGWVQDLGSSNFDEREIATQRLLDLGPRAVPLLEKAVKSSKDSEVRWNAKRLLREIRESQRRSPSPPRPERGGPERMDDLIRQMESQQRELRRMIEEHFRPFHRESDPFAPFDDPFQGFDFGDFERRIRELEERIGTGGVRMGTTFSFRSGPDGVRLEVTEVVDGKEETRVFEAEDMEAFRKKYPEIAEKYGVSEEGGMGFRFRIGGEQPRFRESWREAFPRFRSSRSPREPSLPSERLGVEIDAVEPSLAAFLELPVGVGLLVRRVEKGSLAERMGVQVRDVLISINGREIRGSESILRTLRETSAGEEVKLEVSRAGSGRLTLKGVKPKVEEKVPQPLEKVEEKK